MADVRREIGEIRQRISTSVRMAERRASALNARIDVVVARYRATAAAAGGRRKTAY